MTVIGMPHVRYVATIPCESVSHKSNTFHTILALCTCLYRSHLQKPVSMKQTKHSRKSEAQNSCSKCPPYVNTCIQTTTSLRNRCCCDDGVVQQPPLAQQTFFQLLHIMDPSLEGYPRCCNPSDSNLANWMATSLNWSDKLLASLSAARWQCHVHGERHDFSDINITSPGKGCTLHAT